MHCIVVLCCSTIFTSSVMCVCYEFFGILGIFTMLHSTPQLWGFLPYPAVSPMCSGQNASKESIRKAILRGKLKMPPGSWENTWELWKSALFLWMFGIATSRNLCHDWLVPGLWNCHSNVQLIEWCIAEQKNQTRTIQFWLRFSNEIGFPMR